MDSNLKNKYWAGSKLLICHWTLQPEEVLQEACSSFQARCGPRCPSAPVPSSDISSLHPEKPSDAPYWRHKVTSRQVQTRSASQPHKDGELEVNTPPQSYFCLVVSTMLWSHENRDKGLQSYSDDTFRCELLSFTLVT